MRFGSSADPEDPGPLTTTQNAKSFCVIGGPGDPGPPTTTQNAKSFCVIGGPEDSGPPSTTRNAKSQSEDLVHINNYL